MQFVPALCGVTEPQPWESQSSDGGVAAELLNLGVLLSSMAPALSSRVAPSRHIRASAPLDQDQDRHLSTRYVMDWNRVPEFTIHKHPGGGRQSAS